MRNKQELIEKNSHFLTAQTWHSFEQLQEILLKYGVDLQILSSYRSYEHQLNIWNDKALGKRPLLDINERPINLSQLSKSQALEALLLYSAIPGFSRHHFGTDFDIYDAKIKTREEVQLTKDEFINDFTLLNQMLNKEMLLKFDLFRPYHEDSHLKLSPEPWHLSYLPDALSFDKKKFINFIEQHPEIMFQKEILQRADYIFEYYIDARC